MNTSIPMVGVGIAQIAEPGDGTLGRVLAKYLELIPGGYVVAYQQFLLDLERGIDAIALPDDVSMKELADGVHRWQPRQSAELARFAVSKMETHGIEVMFPDDDKWPVRINRLGVHAPRVLFIKGDANLFSHGELVGVVGARAATGYGEHVTQTIVAELADRGTVIVSGAAYGIDGMAHRTALASDGKTIAFLAGGLDRFYPAGHDGLLERIGQAGLIVSEVEPGASPTKWRFLQRNRLIAAASDAVVVIEAGLRSGSLNTVGHAAALRVPIAAVPGPITSPASAGCHRAITDYSAALVTSASDIVALLDR